ncbi:MAG: hypothetical protein PF503_25695 [Desulfobacula sp.]|nr:hypothetical protein [Desulfobacula sp.]
MSLSQRGKGLTVPSLSILIKGWCRKVNLNWNYASHTLRKTWGYHQRVTFKVALPEQWTALTIAPRLRNLPLCVSSRKRSEGFMRKSFDGYSNFFILNSLMGKNGL